MLRFRESPQVPKEPGLKVWSQSKHLSRLSRKVQEGAGPLAGLLRSNGLHPVYQSIAGLKDGAVFAHEALIRGPQGTELHSPAALFKAAVLENLNFDLENVSAVSAIERWGEMRNPGRLFVNISAQVLVELLARHGSDALVALVGDLEVLPRMLVLEITELERVADMDHLASTVEAVRRAAVGGA